MTISRTLRLSLWYCCLVGLLTPTAFAQDKESSLTNQLPVEVAASALEFESFERSPIDISPDGHWVAYVLKNPRLKEPQTENSGQVRFTRTGVPSWFWGCDVWITNTKSGESKNLTESKGTSWGPRWSPDGSLLAFYSDRNGLAHLWIWEKSSGKVRQVSDAIVRPWTEAVVWRPDSKSIITKILPQGENLDDLEKTNASVIDRRQTDAQRKQQQTSPRVLVYSSPPVGNKIEADDPRASNLELPSWTNSLRGELVLVDVSGGKLQFLAKRVRPNLFSVSPDGTHVVLSVPKRRKTPNSLTLLYDLVVVSLANLHSKVISEFSPGAPSLPVSWSSDGTLLSYVSDGECFIYPMSGGDPRKASKTSHPGFTSKPVWDATGQFIYLLGGNALWKIVVSNGSIVPLLRDSRRLIVGLITPRKDMQEELYLGTRNDQSKQQGFYKIKLSTGEVSRLIENNKMYNLSLSDVSADGQQIVFGAQDAQHDENLWITDPTFRNPRQLTRINPEFGQVRMGTSRLIEYKSSDGQELRGALLLPAGYMEGKRYPLIVKVYGGVMLSNYVNQFGFPAFGNDSMQLFATRGYGVLMPDTPLRVGTPMQDLAKTVLPAVDKVIELGVADPERLGIMGHSYGGYSTLSLIVQTTRFKAAHMDAGQGDLVSMYGATMMKSGDTFGVAWAEEGQGRMGGTPWEFRERYIENSPVFYLDRVRTPLLITQGALDLSPFHSDEIFVGLRRLGKEVVYAKYEGEGHGIVGYAAKIDYWNRMIDWFDVYLKNSSQKSQ